MKAALLLLSLILASCASKQWSASHPYYRESPSAQEEIAVLGLHHAVVVTRDKWFAKHLEIPRDSVYLLLGRQVEEAFIRELQNTRYPNLSIWPDSLYEKLPEETQRLDEKIFIKGHFPAQGVKLQNANGSAPKHLILIHECTLGLDLVKDNFFDYTLINNEEEAKRTSEALTVILSYTLWDNENQRALYSAVAEVPLAIPHDIQPGDVAKVSIFAADSLVAGIDGGVR
ncbi:MAG: hypothetical protein J6Z31_07625 [Fibrobacter sp.]|nr:hypothetical protein [Fibrobacter sp.]